VLGLAMALVVALATIGVIGKSWIAHGVVVAPNSGKSFDAAGVERSRGGSGRDSVSWYSASLMV